jgi:hypothetical protein
MNEDRITLHGSLALTKLFILALDMAELGPDHPWRHVYLKMLDEEGIDE